MSNYYSASHRPKIDLPITVTYNELSGILPLTDVNLEDLLLFKLLILLTFVQFGISNSYAKQSFDRWKKSFIRKAAKRGIPSKFTKKQFKDLKLNVEIIKKDRNQVTASKEIDYQKWIKTWLRKNPSRIEEAKQMLKENKDALLKVEKVYGVPKEVIVALWGVESLFGKIQGDYDLIESLSALAYEGRRKRFFEIQLMSALRLIYQGQVSREDLKGSWAGATGQCQFMPSNIPGFAKDFNKDGKKDIWNTKEDVFASIAYLLKKGGWKRGSTIGSLAITTKGRKFKFNKYRSAKTYNILGLRNLDGTKLNGKWKRIISEIRMKNSPVVLRGGNYEALMKWNRSSLFAAFAILIIDGLNH